MLAPLTLGASAAMLLVRVGAVCGLVACAVSRAHAPPPAAVEGMPADTSPMLDTSDTSDTTATTYTPPPEPPPLSPLTLERDLSDLTMADARVGWGITYDGERNSWRILRTEDGGDHFAVTGPVVDSGSVCGHAFVDGLHAHVAVCTDRTDVPLLIHRTSDGGRTWSYVTVIPKEDAGSTFGVESFAFRDAQHGTFVATVEDDEARAPVALFRTSDGGLTWKEAGPASLSTVENLDDGHAWAMQGWGATAPLLRAKDGTTFQWMPNLTGCTVDALPTFFGRRGSVRAACASGTRFARTADGGDHWTFGEETEPDAAIDFLDADRGWVVGKQGTFATRDGGLTSSKLNEAARETVELTMLSSTVGLLQVLTDDQPELLRTSDGGKSWHTALPPLRHPRRHAGRPGRRRHERLRVPPRPARDAALPLSRRRGELHLRRALKVVSPAISRGSRGAGRASRSRRAQETPIAAERARDAEEPALLRERRDAEERDAPPRCSASAMSN